MSYLYNTPAYNKYKETLAGKRNPIINTECDIELVNQDDFLAFGKFHKAFSFAVMYMWALLTAICFFV